MYTITIGRQQVVVHRHWAKQGLFEVKEVSLSFARVLVPQTVCSRQQVARPRMILATPSGVEVDVTRSDLRLSRHCASTMSVRALQAPNSHKGSKFELKSQC
jgi:hypothetical protein